jgi:hypothetical protein
MLNKSEGAKIWRMLEEAKAGQVPPPDLEPQIDREVGRLGRVLPFIREGPLRGRIPAEVPREQVFVPMAWTAAKLLAGVERFGRERAVVEAALLARAIFELCLTIEWIAHDPTPEVRALEFMQYTFHQNLKLISRGAAFPETAPIMKTPQATRARETAEFMLGKLGEAHKDLGTQRPRFPDMVESLPQTTRTRLRLDYNVMYPLLSNLCHPTLEQISYVGPSQVPHVRFPLVLRGAAIWSLTVNGRAEKVCGFPLRDFTSLLANP